jgi:hypothetical protein
MRRARDGLSEFLLEPLDGERGGRSWRPTARPRAMMRAVTKFESTTAP